MEKSVRSIILVPRSKPENEKTRQCHVVAMFADVDNTLKWCPTPRQVLECLVFRLMKSDKVTKILWYRGPARKKMQPFHGKSMVST